jgi:hypothetical protein
MISPALIRRLFGILPLVSSLAFFACGPNAAPAVGGSPTPSGSLPPSEASRSASQVELAKAFDDSTATLLELKTVEQFSQVKMNAEAVLIPGGDGFAVKVTGNDPVLFLPPFAAGKYFILKVVIEAPVQTGMQLFYMLRDAPTYDETRSQLIALTKGRNVVYFRVNQPDVIDPVRLDPAYNVGDYKIESIEAHEMAKPTIQ